MLELALAQLPAEITSTHTVLARSDTAGASHDFVNDLRENNIRFSVGLDLTDKGALPS